jgi:ubiquinone/menaquinone biosynthesis C-methylase UbiE
MNTSTLTERLFARIYEPSLRAGERRGMGARRAALLADADGRVLEIGAGTGLNLPHYPPSAELTLTEPVAPMRRILQERVRAAGRRAEVLDTRAEVLPFSDGAFDVVVSTLVLCTVEDPNAALGEIHRVLRPGGRLLFIEHVHAEGGVRRWLQDRLARPWAAFAGGCRCNRPITSMIRRHFPSTAAADGVWRGVPGLVRPLTVGHATA